MFGGLIKGIENDGRIQTAKLPFVLGGAKFMGIGSNWEQSLPLASNGSMTTAFSLFFLIYPKFLR